MNEKRKQVMKLIKHTIKNMPISDDRLFKMIPATSNKSLSEVAEYIKEFKQKIDNDKFIQNCINALGLNELVTELGLSDWKQSRIIKMNCSMYNFDRYK